MSFKNLMKRYAGTSTSSKLTTSTNPSSGEDEQASKRTRLATKKVFLVLSVHLHSDADCDVELSASALLKFFLDIVSSSTYSVSVEQPRDCHYDPQTSRLLIVSPSKSILEVIATAACSRGALFDKDKPCSFRILRVGSVDESDNRLTDKAFVASLLSDASGPSFSVVVARYREPVDWVSTGISSKVHLYNKAPLHDDQISRFFSVHTLPNVGRESHTYLHHIVDNYDSLTDIVYFTQAHPFDHAPHFLSSVMSNVGLCRPYQGLSDVTGNVYDCNVQQYERMFPGIQEGFTRTLRELFGKEMSPATIRFYPGAIMAVHKSLIHRRPREFYRQCLSLLDHSVDPIEGYTFERIWSLIFDDAEMEWPLPL